MKILRRIAVFALIAGVLVTASYVFFLSPRRVVPILMYHSISDSQDSSMYVSPRNFERQMSFLNDRGYRVISLDELVDDIKQGRGNKAKTVVITFDDGFEDNYLKAFPILARYDFPATVFLATGYVGKEGYLNWDQVNVMIRGGIDFGSHTRNHAYLPSVENTFELWEEVAGSRDDIARATGKIPGFLAYPIGGFNDKVKLAVKKAGYRGACTTNRGYDRYNRDVFELRRIKVSNSDTTKPFNFRAKLSGFYDLFRSVKSPE